MFDKSRSPEPRGQALLEQRLAGLLCAGDGVDAPYVLNPSSRNFVFDVIDYPVRDAWLRRSIMNRPIRPDLVGVGTFARLLEDGAGHLERARSADLVMARASAVRAKELAAFARARPASLIDRGEGEVGAASAVSRAARPAPLLKVSEWAADEVAAALRLSPSAATTLLTECLVLVDLLPRTLSMLEEGRIGWAQAQVLAEFLAPVREEKRAEAESRLLARAEGKTREQLRAAARRVVARVDARAAAERLVRAIRERQVTVFPGEDGMATLYAAMATPVARACYAALERYADACAVDGDERTKAQRMVDCLGELILRPGEHGLPPVQVQLTVVAAVETFLGGDEPGEVDGDVVPAALVRELAYTLGLMPRPTEQPAPDEREVAGASGSENLVALLPGGSDDPATTTTAAPTPGTMSTSGGSDEGARRRELAGLMNTGRVGGTALAHRPHIAVVERLSGTLLALTNAAEVRSGQAIGPPPDSPGYRPRDQLERFVRLRDRRCRFPGCRARPRRCDLDHTRPWPSGPTAHGNLCCLCEHHHRLSHQAPGWLLLPAADGGLSWTTPGGEILTTYPPPFGAGEGHLERRDPDGRESPGTGAVENRDASSPWGETPPRDEEPQLPPF